MIRVIFLAWKLMLAAHVELPIALKHACLAVANETDSIPAEILLGVVSVETNFNPRMVSVVRGQRFCGLMQVYANSDTECRSLRNLVLSYRRGVAELKWWMKNKRVNGDVKRLLQAHGCGIPGIGTRCPDNLTRDPYDVRVMRFASKLWE